VDRILATADRSTAVGRRDYAVLLLAARYGLRPCDIRQLTLDHIDWRHARLDIRQAKTGRPLALPLLPEVAEALSAYVRDGRPATASRVVFVRHRAPFEPLAAGNNLAPIMRAALQRAGLADRQGRRGGLLSAAPFLDLVIRLRGRKPIIPRGVHRFRTFEESEQWSMRMMARPSKPVPRA